MPPSISRPTRNGTQELSGHRRAPPTDVDQQVKPLSIDGQGNIWSVAFLVDGDHIVSGGEGGKIQYWRVEDGENVGTAMEAGSTVHDIAVSQDGKWIVSGTATGQVTVWGAESCKKGVTLKGHTAYGVFAVDVSPDGTRIATGNVDNVCVWSLSTGKRLLGPWKHNWTVVGARFSPDGHLVATATWNGTVRIYDSNQNSRLPTIDIPIQVSPSFNQSFAWTNDSKELYVLSHDGKIHCFDVSGGASCAPWAIHNKIEPRRIALASNGTFIAASAGSSISFWDTTTHAQIGPVVHHAMGIESMAISANYDLLLGGGNKIILSSLFDTLPLAYYDDIFPERAVQHMKRLEKRLKTLRMREEGFNSDIARLEEIVRQLRDQVSDSQHRADTLDKAIESLRVQDDRTISQLKQERDDVIEMLRAHEQTRQCEALYARGRIIDASVSLLAMTKTVNDKVRADGIIMDWVAKFRSECIPKLEITGDQAIRTEEHDRAVAAYSTALMLGPLTPNTLLTKWADAVLTRSSVSETLSDAVKFKLPQFDIHRTVCDILKDGGRISEAIECFQHLQDKLGEDAGSLDAADEMEWVANFKACCLKTSVERGDIAMDSASYEDAVIHYTTALTLEPVSTSLLVKRSKARAGARLWKESLEDADAVIKLDPSSPDGYKSKQAALFGAQCYDDAIVAHDDMLVKLEQSADPVIRESRKHYVSPSETMAAIRKFAKWTQQDAPLVLINTGTGRLCDQDVRLDTFEADPKFQELVASVTTQHDKSRITQGVQQYFQYATFSHTWDGAEPLFHDLLHQSVDKLESSPTTFKLTMFCVTARKAGLRWAWSDTCCINKGDSSVLQESLTSMFKWYHESALTIVHLKGVLSDSELVTLVNCFWNTRAWTLQEFFASRTIRFYTEDWKLYLPHEDVYNHKESAVIMREMAAANGVDVELLHSLRPGSENVRQKLCLAAARVATKQEDIAYSLFGIFKVSIPVTYGEGQEHALGRLLQEVLTRSGDVTILAWTGKTSEYNSCLPAEIGVYRESVSPYIPSPIDDDKLRALVAELQIQTSSCPHAAVPLYDQIITLPSPRLFSQRLTLSCIMFPLRIQPPVGNDHEGTYCGTTSALGDVKIETLDDLSSSRDLVLVHPWLKCLLDPTLPSIDSTSSYDDAMPLTPVDRVFMDADFVTSPSSSSHPLLPFGGLQSDRDTKALRLFARLRQPFGALLLESISHNEYRRVASDRPIVVQLQQNVSPRYLLEKIRTVDVL